MLLTQLYLRRRLSVLDYPRPRATSNSAGNCRHLLFRREELLRMFALVATLPRSSPLYFLQDNALKKKLEMQAGKKSGREGAGAAASARDGDVGSRRQVLVVCTALSQR